MIASTEPCTSPLTTSSRPPAGRNSRWSSRATCTDDRLDRALHVALDDQREFLAAVGLELAHHLLERAAQAGRPCRHLVALLPRPVIGDLAGPRFALDHRQPVAGVGRAAEAEHLDRH